MIETFTQDYFGKFEYEQGMTLFLKVGSTHHKNVLGKNHDLGDDSLNYEAQCKELGEVVNTPSGPAGLIVGIVILFLFVLTIIVFIWRKNR